MIVASMVATACSLPTLMAKASAVQTVSVRPALLHLRSGHEDLARSGRKEVHL